MKETNKKKLINIILYYFIIAIVFFIIVALLNYLVRQDGVDEYDTIYTSQNKDNTIKLSILTHQQMTFGDCDVKIKVNDNVVMSTSIGNDGKRIIINKNIICDWINNNTIFLNFSGEEQYDENVKIKVFKKYISIERNTIGDDTLWNINEIQNLDNSLSIMQTEYIDLIENKNIKRLEINGYEYIVVNNENKIDELESTGNIYSVKVLSQNKFELISKVDNVDNLVVEKFNNNIFVNGIELKFEK